MATEKKSITLTVAFGALWGALAIPLLPCVIWLLDRASGAALGNIRWLVLLLSVALVTGVSAAVHRAFRVAVVTAVTGLILAGVGILSPLATFFYAWSGRPL